MHLLPAGENSRTEEAEALAPEHCMGTSLLCCSASSTVSRGHEHAHLALHSLLNQHTRSAHRTSGFLENPMPESRMPITLEELDHASTLVYRVMAPTPQ